MDNGTGKNHGPIRVLGIGGSMRRGSLSLTALEAAMGLAETAGARIALADVRSLNLPLYDEDRPLADYPPALAQLLADARAADAYLLCSPTYHGTVAGGVKNVLDALNFLGDDTPPYFAGKPVALMALGGGGAQNVLTALHHATRGLNGLTIATAVAVPGRAVDAASGTIGDEAVRRRMTRMVEELIDVGRRLRRPTAAETRWADE